MADAEGVQQELQDYLQKKGINTLFINLVESLLLAKPENPISHIIQYLQSNYPEQALPKKKSFSHPNTPKDVDPAASNHHPHTSTGSVFFFFFFSLSELTTIMRLDHHSDESESEDEDEGGDAVGEIRDKPEPPRPIVKGRRTSVSAETIDPSRCASGISCFLTTGAEI
jgi:cAMP-dependent protein kinase regulator